MTPEPADPSRRLHLAVVTETYPPEVNGVATTVAQLVQGLQARGHRLQLVRPRQPADGAGAPAAAGLDALLVRGLPIPRYPQLKMGLPARPMLLARWTRQRPDLVHIATEGPLGWSALQAAAALGLPVTSDFRTNFHAYSRHYGLGWLQRPIMAYLRGFHNRTRCTMAPTAALQRELAAAGFERVQVVARGVDATRFTPGRRSAALREAWGAGPQTRVVACVGRLAPEKNLALLRAGFDAFRRRWPDSLLLLVGDGPARAALQAQWPDAVFAGIRTGEDLVAHYASADVFAFPSATETYGNVTPEAMACGLPVVAFDYAAAAQLIRHGHNGLLAAPGDDAGFVAGLERLAADPLLAARCGALARQTAVLHRWARVITQVEGHLLQALAPPDAPQAGRWQEAEVEAEVEAT